MMRSNKDTAESMNGIITRTYFKGSNTIDTIDTAINTIHAASVALDTKPTANVNPSKPFTICPPVITIC